MEREVTVTFVRCGGLMTPNRRLKGAFQKSFNNLNELAIFLVDSNGKLCVPHLQKELGDNQILSLRNKVYAYRRRKGYLR